MSIWARLIIAGLVCMAVLFVSIVISTAIWWEEQKLEEKRKEREEKKQKIEQESISMCIKTRQANACPGVCNKCAWGRTTIELRGRRL